MGFLFGLVAGLIVAGLLGYVIFMIFLPEWVGITGDAAKKINDSHAGGESDDVDFVFPENQKKK